MPRGPNGNWWYRPIYFLIVVSQRGVALSRAVAGCTELCQETACSGCSTYFVLKLLGAFGCFWYNDVVACLLLTMWICEHLDVCRLSLLLPGGSLQLFRKTHAFRWLPLVSLVYDEVTTSFGDTCAAQCAMKTRIVSQHDLEFTNLFPTSNSFVRIPWIEWPYCVVSHGFSHFLPILWGLVGEIMVLDILGKQGKFSHN